MNSNVADIFPARDLCGANSLGGQRRPISRCRSSPVAAISGSRGIFVHELAAGVIAPRAGRADLARQARRHSDLGTCGGPQYGLRGIPRRAFRPAAPAAPLLRDRRARIASPQSADEHPQAYPRPALHDRGTPTRASGDFCLGARPLDLSTPTLITARRALDLPRPGGGPVVRLFENPRDSDSPSTEKT